MTAARLVGCARMYAAAPAAAAAWCALFARIAQTSGVAIDVVDHPYPAPLQELWGRPDLACAFMCGYPWSLERDPPELLAAPVPSLARYADQPIYFTDLIVRADSSFETIEDTFGGRLAYTIDSSHSGYNAVRNHLLRYRTPSRRILYRETVGPLVTPRRVLDAVMDGRADVGPLDSYVLDLWRRHQPDLVRGVHVIATTESAPIPPLVASRGVGGDARARLTAALLDVHRPPDMAATLDALLISRFAPAVASAFDIFRERHRAAEQAGYAVLA